MKNHHIEELFTSFFEGTITQDDREKIEQWKKESEENRQIFADSLRAWESMELLWRMKKYDPEKAIHQVNFKIGKQGKIRMLDIFRKVAAILFLPLIITTFYFAIEKSRQPESFVAWHTIETTAGMRSEFILPDSSKVFLNSNTRLSYPLAFNSKIREVKLTGQAYFEVTENKKVPFVVNTGRLNIEVTGTEFMATNYLNENLTEVALIEGGINLFYGDYFNAKKDIVQIKPGQMAFLKTGDNELITCQVDIKKYQAWKNGILLFRDDSMYEVIRSLSRWFNVDIQLTGPEFKDYVYTATFEDETLVQVLELLKMSAPIDYKIKKRERKADTTFSKMEVEIIQKRN